MICPTFRTSSLRFVPNNDRISILNLAEPDFFSWALETAVEWQFLDVFHTIFRRLEEFDWTKLDEDVLKMLYQELIDPADRRGLGEYYTPDWVAELMLEDIGYTSGSLLDPVLRFRHISVTAIHQLRKAGLSGKPLVEYVMNNIQGGPHDCVRGFTLSTASKSDANFAGVPNLLARYYEAGEGELLLRNASGDAWLATDLPFARDAGSLSERRGLPIRRRSRRCREISPTIHPSFPLL